MPYAFESEYIEIVCDADPANDPGGTGRASPYVKYSYASSEM